MKAKLEKQRHEIYGELQLRLEPIEQLLNSPIRPSPRVALVEGNYVTHLGRWLQQYNLEGKRVKITIEEI